MVVPVSIDAKLLEPGGSLKIISGTSGAIVANATPPVLAPPLTIPSALKASLLEIFNGLLPGMLYWTEIEFIKPSVIEMFGSPAKKVYLYCCPLLIRAIVLLPVISKLFVILKEPSVYILW